MTENTNDGFAPDPEQDDVEGHLRSLGVADEDDVEGHRAALKTAGEEEDTEGHFRAALDKADLASTPDEDDVEGHVQPRRDIDVER